jgi:hypothetical protein
MRTLSDRSRGNTGRHARTRALLGAATVAIGLALAPAGSRAGELIDRVLAVVSGETITQSDVQGALALGLIETSSGGDPAGAALGQFIDRTLMLAEVRRFAPSEPTAREVQARVELMQQRFESPAALARALAASGIDEERLRLLARDDLRIRAYLAERFAGTPQPTEPQVDEYLRDGRQASVRDGRPLSEDEARERARQELASERRQALVAEWLVDLRRRADITVPGQPAR